MKRLVTCSALFVVLFFPIIMAEPAFATDYSIRPASLRGGMDKIRYQYQTAARFGISPVQSGDDIRRRFENGELVKVRGVCGSIIDPDFDRGYPYKGLDDALWYVYPHVQKFVTWYSCFFYNATGEHPTFTSFGRTPYRYAQIEGSGNTGVVRCRKSDPCRPHTLLSVTDISRKRMSPEARMWTREFLEILQDLGWVVVVEEILGTSNNFHVFVHPQFGNLYSQIEPWQPPITSAPPMMTAP